MLDIVDFHLRVEQFSNVVLIVLRRNPPLTELKSDVIKGNLLGDGLLQSSLGLFQLRDDSRVIGMFLRHFKGIVHIGELVIDVAGEYLAADFIVTIRHIVDTSLQVIGQLLLCLARQAGHILQVYLAVSVQ